MMIKQPNRDIRVGQARPAQGSRPRRGSALVFAVVCLVLMVLLGMSYLQMARVERLAISEVGDGNIDTVRDSVIALIAQILNEDLTDRNGSFFNPAPPNEAGDEPYDHAWTNNDFSIAENNPAVVFMDGTSATAVGGHLDDTWLAASTLAFVFNNPVWPHISNVTNMYLWLPHHNMNGFETQPAEITVDNTDANPNTTWRHDTDVPIFDIGTIQTLEATDFNYQALGADADGDRILDSKWTWAPIRQIGAVRYVMALRIVDQSAMININAATAFTSDGTSGFPATPAHHTTGLDLTRLLRRHGYAQWGTELSNVLGFRGVDNSIAPTPLGANSFPDGSQFGTWLDSVRLYGLTQTNSAINPGYVYNKYTLQDELEIRHAAGLNNGKVQSPLEATMPNLLRDSLATEGAYWDAVGQPPPGSQNAAASAMADYMVGGTPGSQVASRTYPAIRHMITAHSGAAVFAANHGDMHQGSGALKYDLVWRHRDNSPPSRIGVYGADADNDDIEDRVKEIADRIERALRVTDMGTMNNAYLGRQFDPNNSDTLGGPELKQIATEYALNIQGYTDDDNVPSSAWLDIDEDATRGASAAEQVTYYGLERLPFIREVYAQIGFLDTDQIDAGGLPITNVASTGPDGVFDTWVFQAGSDGMAIEIGNPFSRDIDFNVDRPQRGRDRAKLDLRIEINAAGNVTIINVNSNLFDDYTTGVAQPLNDFSISPGGRVIIYSDPMNAVAEDDTNGGTKGDKLLELGFDQDRGDGTPDIILRAKTDGLLSFPTPLNGSTVTVELHLMHPGPDDVFRNADDRHVPYDRFPLNNLDLDTTNFQHGPHPSDPTTAHPVHRQGGVARDGRMARFISNDGMDIVDGSVRILDHLGYRYIGNTTAGASVQDRLNLDDKTVNGDTQLDNLATSSTNTIEWTDAMLTSVVELDNLLMFGFTDELSGDLPQRLDAGGLASNRRRLQDTPIPTSTGLPHRVLVLDEFTTLSPADDGVDNDNDGVTDETDEQFAPGTLNVNTVPLHVATLAAPIPDANIDNIETTMTRIFQYRDAVGATRTGLPGLRTQPGIAALSELLIAPNVSAADTRLLSQAFSTRSDLYCAYVLIRGYPAADFRLGPVEATQFFVIYDRSHITQPSDTVRVLGVFKVF